ncbi:MAG TPA: alpha/beta fold hydrolase [Steroidobacteraceae bacterium]|nr:alpha/beta fold hydrolase [Steroidobacteraceae bacterium]
MAPARIRSIVHGLSSLLLIVLGTATAAGAPPPAEAFASLPAVSDVTLSPSGNLLAWADRSGAEERVVIFDLAAGKIRHQLAIGHEMKLRYINWADDQIALVELSQTEKHRSTNDDRYRYEFFRILAIDVDSGKGHVLLMTQGAQQLVTGATLEAFYTDKPKTVIMSTLDYAIGEARSEMGTRLAGKEEDSPWVSKLFEVDTLTGKGKPIETGSQFTRQWVIDSAGHCVGRSEWNPKANNYRVLANRTAGWKEIYARKDGAQLTLHGVTEDGAAIIAIGPNDAGRQVLYSVALDGSGARVLFEDPQYDVSAVDRDRFTRAPVGVWLGGPTQEIHWFDPKAKARADSVSRAFKGRTVQIYGRSQDGKRVLARVDSPSKPSVYYLVDFNRHAADIAGEEYPALADAQLGEMRATSYKARDGTSIPAYLTVPPGSNGKNLPLVVLVHGGPYARDDFAFDWWAQFMATRGYAVLQPQFRGSTGYGDAFESAGYRQWGGLMQDDVSDGVKALVEDGTADAKRVCIVGASYGGYAALAGAAFTPDLYKCAVSVSGVSDLPALLGSEKEKWGRDDPDYLDQVKRIGSPLDPVLAQRSPVHAAEKIRIPILLIHGQDDTVVPIAQSQAMAHALEQAHKQCTFVKLSGEDHWMSGAKTRLEIMQEIEKFLAANL